MAFFRIKKLKNCFDAKTEGWRGKRGLRGAVVYVATGGGHEERQRLRREACKENAWRWPCVCWWRGTIYVRRSDCGTLSGGRTTDRHLR